jgi:quinol---cytochrome-c reductase cytochrome c subunit
MRVDRLGRWFPLLSTVVLCGAMGAALWPTFASGSPSPRRADVDADALYLRDCAVCHGVDGEGSTRGPSLANVGAASAQYWLSTGRMPLAAPGDQPARGPSPYTDAEIDALVDKVADLGGRDEPIPRVDLEGADVARGGEIYRLNCAACHQAVGQGGALANRDAPPLDRSTPQQIADAVRVGPGQMPAFGVAAIPDDQLSDLVAYVRELAEPDDRGGLAIWHLGPVPEGAIAIIVGLGLLILITRWIGRDDTDPVGDDTDPVGDDTDPVGNDTGPVGEGGGRSDEEVPT